LHSQFSENAFLVGAVRRRIDAEPKAAALLLSPRQTRVDMSSSRADNSSTVSVPRAGYKNSRVSFQRAVQRRHRNFIRKQIIAHS
jgi:hypothetical protein